MGLILMKAPIRLNGVIAGCAAASALALGTTTGVQAQSRSIAPPGPAHMSHSLGNGPAPRPGTGINPAQHGPAPLGTVPTRSANPVSSKGNSSSVMGIPAPSTGAPGKEPTVAQPSAAKHPAENYYGDNSSGTYGNTENAAGPSSTEPESSMTAPNQSAGGPPSGSPVQNPNSVVSVSPGGPAANGTGQPMFSNDVKASTIPAPPQETGSYENPQESPSAFGWIIVASVLLIGSIFGTIKLTQPGGQA